MFEELKMKIEEMIMWIKSEWFLNYIKNHAWWISFSWEWWTSSIKEQINKLIEEKPFIILLII